MMNRTLGAILLATGALYLPACGDSAPSSEAADAGDLVVRTDTTEGVVRVHSEGTPPAWELRLETEIGEIGGTDAASPAEFGSLYSLGWVGDTLAVLDPGVGRIGLFDPEGRWLGQHGYPGGVSGPSSLIRLYPGGDDEVYAFRLEAVEGELQRRFQRITAGGAEGTLPWLEGPDGPLTGCLRPCCEVWRPCGGHRTVAT